MDLKHSLYAAARTVVLRRALGKLRSTPEGQAPGRSVLSRLRTAWGNPSYTASVSYLEAVASRTIGADGPILECGSGLSTLLIAVPAQAQGLGV